MTPAFAGDEMPKPGDITHPHGQSFEILDAKEPIGSSQLVAGDTCSDFHSDDYTTLEVLKVVNGTVFLRYTGGGPMNSFACNGQFTTSVSLEKYHNILKEDERYRIKRVVERAEQEKRLMSYEKERKEQALKVQRETRRLLNNN